MGREQNSIVAARTTPISQSSVAVGKGQVMALTAGRSGLRTAIDFRKDVEAERVAHSPGILSDVKHGAAPVRRGRSYPQSHAPVAGTTES